jgi:ribonuclease HI
MGCLQVPVMPKPPHLIAYADGSCLGNPGPGGWGVVLVDVDGSRREFSGAAASTTNNRMEITAAIEAVRRSPPGAELTIRTDSLYLVKTMTAGWKRRENLDLWKILDAEIMQRKVHWEWVRGHAGDALNELADELARTAALKQKPINSLSNLKSITTAQPDLVDSSGRRGSSKRQLQTPELPVRARAKIQATPSEAEIGKLLRPLLKAGETLGRCAACNRLFVAMPNFADREAYCSLAACQLKRRRNELK